MVVVVVVVLVVDAAGWERNSNIACRLVVSRGPALVALVALAGPATTTTTSTRAPPRRTVSAAAAAAVVDFVAAGLPERNNSTASAPMMTVPPPVVVVHNLPTAVPVVPATRYPALPHFDGAAVVPHAPAPSVAMMMQRLELRLVVDAVPWSL